MKKIFTMVLLVTTFTACQKDPDFSDLNDDYLVYTNNDPQAVFSSYDRFYIPDSILLIGRSESQEAVYWKDANALEIVNRYVTHLQEADYTRTRDKRLADIGIQLSYVESISYFVDYPYPYWWEGYPYWWGAAYWGQWGSWYYPYTIVYSYAAGSLMGQAVNLNAQRGPTQQLPVVWNSFMTGLLSGNAPIDMERTLDAVDQSFVQSPYFHK